MCIGCYKHSLTGLERNGFDIIQMQKKKTISLSAKGWSFRYDLYDIYMYMAMYENSWAQGWMAKAVIRPSYDLNMAFIRPW